MSPNNDGEYKLLFCLPVFQDTREILFLDFEAEGLMRKLSTLDIDVYAGSIARFGSIRKAAGRGYDAIIMGRLPEGRSEEKRVADAFDELLSESGYLVVVVSNRFGYKRLLEKFGGRGQSVGRGVQPASTGKTASLCTVYRILRNAGFTDINTFSPIPDLVNPSVIVSLASSNSLEFLFSQFPGFMKARSRLIDGILKLLVRTGIYRYLLKEYVIVAGKRWRR